MCPSRNFPFRNFTRWPASTSRQQGKLLPFAADHSFFLCAAPTLQPPLEQNSLCRVFKLGAPRQPNRAACVSPGMPINAVIVLSHTIHRIVTPMTAHIVSLIRATKNINPNPQITRPQTPRSAHPEQPRCARRPSKDERVLPDAYSTGAVRFTRRTSTTFPSANHPSTISVPVSAKIRDPMKIGRALPYQSMHDTSHL